MHQVLYEQVVNMKLITEQERIVNEDSIEVDNIAEELIDKQLRKQKRRRISVGARGKRTRFSIWSTFDAKVTSHDGSHRCECVVCGHQGSLNADISSSNIIAHTKLKHNTLRSYKL